MERIQCCIAIIFSEIEIMRTIDTTEFACDFLSQPHHHRLSVVFSAKLLGRENGKYRFPIVLFHILKSAESRQKSARLKLKIEFGRLIPLLFLLGITGI